MRTKVTDLQSHSILKGLGLSDEEVFIYHALLGESDYASIRRVAAKTGLNRGTVYESIKRLLDRGLLSYNLKGKRRYYFAERPVRIYELINQKKQELETMEVRAKSLVPRLQAILKRQDGQPLVRFYEHDDGISAILHDVISTVSVLEEKEYYVYSHRDVRPHLYNNFPNFTRQRIRAGIFAKVIKVGKGEPATEHDEVRWLLEPGDTEARCYTLIYGNKVAMISVSADDTPYAVVIEEPGVALMQRMLFNRLWGTLPKVSIK